MKDCKYCGGTWTVDDNGQEFIIHGMGCPDTDGKETEKDLLIEQFQAENRKLKAALVEIYDVTTECYIVNIIDVLRGRAVWGKDGVAVYEKGGE